MMNKKQVFSWLRVLFEPYIIHELMLDELVRIISGSGYESRFYAQLVSRLTLLVTHGITVLQQKEFERLNDSLFSMHISSKGYNIRILFSFFPSGKPVLLLAFYEREGKKKTDYTAYLSPALTRLNTLWEVYRNEHDGNR